MYQIRVQSIVAWVTDCYTNQTLIACSLLPEQQQHQPTLAGPTTR